MPQLISKMKKARINRSEPAAARRAAIDKELEELLDDEPKRKRIPPSPFHLTQVEDILELTRKK